MNYKTTVIALIIMAAGVVLYFNLQHLADFIVDQLFHLNSEWHITQSVRFFLYEVPKVMLLLVLIIFAVGIIRSFFSPERTRKALEGKPLFVGNIMASLLGVVTPFCSCSAIPLFLGFVEAGIPIGVTFSFLIAAPLINEVALVLLIGLFGWKTALIYTSSGLLLAIISGFIIEKLNLQKYVAEWVFQTKTGQHDINESRIPFAQRIQYGIDTVKEIVGKIWIYILIGVGIGSLAHGFIPDAFLATALGAQKWYAVPLAIIVGIPLYSNAAGIIPILSVLMEKGVSLGTALAFMMSVIGLSLPEIIILKKVLKWQFIAVFVGIVGLGILIVGFIFNYFDIGI